MNIIDNADGKGYFIDNCLVFNIENLRKAFSSHVSRCSYCGQLGYSDKNCRFCGAKTFEKVVTFYDKEK